MFQATYKVKVTKQARKHGRSLPISKKDRLEIIDHLKTLKFWPDNREEFEYEKVLGAFEFKFLTKDHWVRAFVYQDDVRKIMFVIKVIVKKTNQLSQVDLINLKTLVSSMTQEIDHFKKEELKKKNGKTQLQALKGGKTNE